MRLNFFYKLYIIRFNSCISPYFLDKKYYSYNQIYNNLLYPQYFNNIADFYFKNIFVGGSVRAFRIIFGLPVNGQRTWSNSSTSSTNNKTIYNLKFNKFLRLSNSKVSSTLFLCEYINLFIQDQWFFEWFSVACNFKYIPYYILKGNFIDIQNILLHNLYFYYKNPFKGKKKKSHRKKRTYPKNKISSGLPFGFSFIYKRQLRFFKAK